MLIPSSLIMCAMIQVLIPGSQADTYEYSHETPPPTVAPSIECGEGWHTVGEQCFKWVHSKVTNWYGASAECEGLGRGIRLAQPRDIAQLAEYMDAEGIVGGAPWDKWLIGARTVFRWDNGEEITNEAPVNNCVILTWLNNFHPRLKSFSCTSKGWSYICEKELIDNKYILIKYNGGRD